MPAERISVIPLGLDAPRTEPRDAKGEEFTVLFVGQLRPYKGVETLVRAAKHIPAGRVVIVGDGPERQRLEQLAADRGATNVVFRGSVDDDERDRLYGSSDVVVMPSISRFEAFGFALLEGMSAGCVPVASALPGVTDVVGDVGFVFCE